MAKFRDLTGVRFGKWTVLCRDLSGTKKCGNHSVWKCQCDCGAVKIVFGHTLTHGESKSCGCARGLNFRVDGRSHSPVYSLWHGIIARCTNPKAPSFSDYGGRGIGVLEQWKTDFWSFESYIKSLGPKPSAKHTLDRSNNNLGYFPGNLRWADRKTQNTNTRRRRPVRCLHKFSLAELKAEVARREQAEDFVEYHAHYV